MESGECGRTCWFPELHPDRVGILQDVVEEWKGESLARSVRERKARCGCRDGEMIKWWLDDGITSLLRSRPLCFQSASGWYKRKRSNSFQ
jgi:hypothetical protein